MPANEIQHTYFASSVDAIRQTFTWTAQPKPNNLLILCLASNQTMSAPNDGTWTLVNTAADTADCAIYAKLALVNESLSITITNSFPAALCAALFEYEGMTNSAAADVTSSATLQGGSNNINCGTTGTTAQANTLAIATVTMADASPIPAITAWDNGFTEATQQNATGSSGKTLLAIARKTLSATGTVTLNATRAAGSIPNEWGGSITVFDIGVNKASSWRKA